MVRLDFIGAICILVGACSPADSEISEVDGVRAAYGEAQKNRTLAPHEMLRRAESSFSPVAFGVHYDRLSGLGLKMIDFGVCRQNKVCTWVDRQNIEHEADDERGVASKAAWIDQKPTQHLNLLGIGVARSREDVISAVYRFLPEPTFDCSQAPPDDIGTNCFMMVGKGFVELKFDDNDALIFARVEAILEYPI